MFSYQQVLSGSIGSSSKSCPRHSVASVVERQVKRDVSSKETAVGPS